MYDDIMSAKLAARVDEKLDSRRVEGVAREKRAIEQQSQWLTETLDETHSLITRLFTELDPVLAQEPNDPSTAMEAESIGNSQLYYSLREKTTTAAMANDRLRTILRTVEL